MNEPITKKDLTEVLSVFKADIISGVNETVKQSENNILGIMMDRLDEIHRTLDEMKLSVDLVEKHDLRIETVEKRTTILKGVIEKDLNKKVAW